MQCQTPATRAVCGARNAYRPARALQAAFLTTSGRRNNDNHDDSLAAARSSLKEYTNESKHFRYHRSGEPPGNKGTSNAKHTHIRFDLGKDAPGSSRRIAEPGVEKTPGALARKSNVKGRNTTDTTAATTRWKTAADGTKRIDYEQYRWVRRGSPTIVGPSFWQDHMSNILSIGRSIRHREMNNRGSTPEFIEEYKRKCNYEPRIISPHAILGERDIPIGWCTDRGDAVVNALGGLESEIQEFAAHMKATPVERIARQAATDDVMSFIEQKFDMKDFGKMKRADVEIYGSEKSGLALPISDIDLRVFFEEKDNSYVRTQILPKRLWHLRQQMHLRPDKFSAITLRTDTQYPILNFVHVPSGIDYQVVANNSTAAQEQVTKKYLAEIPHLLDTFIVVRSFFECRGLTSVFNGGLGSYSIFAMLVASLRTTSTPSAVASPATTPTLSRNMNEKEKEQTHQLLYQHVMTNTVQNWTSNYLQRLLTNLGSHDQAIATPVLDRTKLLQQYRNSTRRLFMFDYDGTLTPIVRDPNAAIPSDRVIRTLKTLAADPHNQVWIISGRDQAFLDEWMGHISELGLSAEHGSFMRPPNCSEWENLTETLDMSWQEEVMKVFNHYSERTQGSFIERKKIALTWHYRRADPEYGLFMARECQKHLEQTVAKHFDVEVMTGKANLEVRPRFVNKGEIAKRLVREYGEEAHQAPDFVFCLGDDFTDEDMFRTLRQSHLPEEHRFATTVGAKTKQTLATWHLLEPSDVISCIALLNGNTDAGNVGAVAAVEGAIPEDRT